MFNKKSQLTMFVIIGIVILSGVLFSLYLESNKANSYSLSNKVSTNSMQPLQSYLQNCLNNYAKQTVKDVAFNGGYFIVKEPFVEIENTSTTIPYYSYNKLFTALSREELIKQVAYEINSYFPLCVYDLNQSYPQYNIEDEGSEATVSFKKDFFIFNVNPKIKIKTKNSEYRLMPLTTAVKSKLMTDYNLAYEFSRDFSMNTTVLDLARLADIANNNNLFFYLVNYKNNTIIISFNSTDYDNKDLIFNFALNY